MGHCAPLPYEVSMTDIILTDIDDVLLHFAHNFEKWLNREKNLRGTQQLIDVFHIPTWLGVTQEQTADLIDEFVGNHHLYACLPAYRDAEKVLPALYKEGWRFIAISAAPDEHWVNVARRVNLEGRFGPIFENVHLTGIGKDSKRQVLKKYDPTFYVEDAGHHAQTAADVGHSVMMMNRKYNSHVPECENLTRVQDWHDVYNIINNSDAHKSTF